MLKILIIESVTLVTQMLQISHSKICHIHVTEILEIFKIKICDISV